MAATRHIELSIAILPPLLQSSGQTRMQYNPTRLFESIWRECHMSRLRTQGKLRSPLDLLHREFPITHWLLKKTNLTR